MRRLQTSDVFAVARIIKYADISDDIAKAVSEGKKEGADPEAVGVNAVLSVFASCGSEKVEPLVYKLLSDVSGISVDDIKTQPIDDTILMIKEIAKENDLIDFFKKASRLTIS